MGRLKVQFTGVNIYIPHKEEKSLLVVLPNGTRLGASRKTARDGTPMKPHWPVFYERIARDRLIIPDPFHFAGERLTFVFDPPRAGDFFKQITPTSGDWLAADTRVIANPDRRVAALIHLAAGTGRTIRPAASCDLTIFPATPGWSKERIVSGIEVTVADIRHVEVRRTPLARPSDRPRILYQRSLGSGEEATFVLGNLCGGKVLEQAEDAGSKLDEDFKWIYELSASSQVQQILADRRPLPRPRVEIHGADAGSKSRGVLDPGEIVSLVGCECSGYLAPPVGFSWSPAEQRPRFQ